MCELGLQAQPHRKDRPLPCCTHQHCVSSTCFCTTNTHVSIKLPQRVLSALTASFSQSNKTHTLHMPVKSRSTKCTSTRHNDLKESESPQMLSKTLTWESYCCTPMLERPHTKNTSSSTVRRQINDTYQPEPRCAHAGWCLWRGSYGAGRLDKTMTVLLWHSIVSRILWRWMIFGVIKSGLVSRTGKAHDHWLEPRPSRDWICSNGTPWDEDHKSGK